jgi:membrane carboxypeptidase/penicillin-binding protein PbpC
MQLARQQYHINSRTIGGKVLQIFRALQIERHNTKDAILEAYLNQAPYGGNIEGVGAASLLYFGKEPSRLTQYESIALSVVPQSPTRRTLRTGSNNAALSAAQNRLAARLDVGGNDFAARAEATRPFLAPHFTRLVLDESPAVREITTTLDADIQRLVERRISGYLESNH